MKKIILIFILIIIVSLMVSCGASANGTAATATDPYASYEKFSNSQVGLFDTAISFIAYTQTRDEFDFYNDMLYSTMNRLHMLFDIYNDYEGIANVKTINDNAGVAPVKVEREIVELILDAKEMHDASNGIINIALGPVLNIWHRARTESNANPSGAYIPSVAELEAALQKCDINNVIVDTEAMTVFLKEPGMRLDVGAIAKGFAVERAIRAVEEAGLGSCILNAGGDVASVGKPMDGRDRWSVGIRDPKLESSGNSNIYDTVFTNSVSVATSGDYQRFFFVDGISYHHIIDPSTLMPANYYSSLSVVHADAVVAEMLSTVLFILPIAEGESFARQWDAEAMWIDRDGHAEATEGYKKISQIFSGYSGRD